MNVKYNKFICSVTTDLKILRYPFKSAGIINENEN